MKFALVIPTYQAGDLWKQWLHSLNEQSVKPDKIIMIDSSSMDGTQQLAIGNGIIPIVIPSSEFNHGGTRNIAAKLAGDVDVLVFMTQDAILHTPFSLAAMVQQFENPMVSAVCGRQLPHHDANPLAAHARLFNYPNETTIKSLEDVSALGIKTVFMSNSFSAYRRETFNRLGGFPNNTILSEDMYLTAKIIAAGEAVVYCADACVRHSHNYSLVAEFRRYFDIGVFHACEPWIQNEFGHASGEGIRFIKSEFSYLLKNAPLWIPKAAMSTICKFSGYKLGRHYKYIPPHLRAHFSMCKSYWPQQND